MFIHKKYKIIVFLNVENTFNAFGDFLIKPPFHINYIQSKKLKIIRDFLFLYSIFLLLLQFDNFIYKSELEFKLRNNSFYFLMLDDSYNSFFI